MAQEAGGGEGSPLVLSSETYPRSTFVGIDGDAYSLDLVSERLDDRGLQGRVTLAQGMLEDIDHSDKFDMAVINVSMHECRDIEKVTGNVRRALKPGGHFVISDFPFPDSTEACRTVPARIMCGIQFFEALIDDQLLPTQAYIDLLDRHGFREVDAFDLSPVHAVTHGLK